MQCYQTMYQTPTTQDARIGPNNIGGNKHRMKRGSIALADQILFQTPTATEIPMRSKEAMEKRKKYRESIGRKTVPHGNLLEQIQMMYPTPVVSDNSLETIEKWKQRRKDKKGTRDQSSFQTLSSCSDVPNTNSRMRRRWGTIGQSGANKIWRFCSEKEKQTGYDIWSKAIGCNALPRKENSSDTNSKGLQGCSLPTELEREQRQVITKRDTEKQQTWWEIESSLCGVPNGISYELDKGRSNRIKALGNSIVPLIAYEIGKAIISAEDQSD
jgi:site-specific DNA-cytosine methylase